jgi:transcriptional regulator with XRE-family HTH domain
MVTAPMILGERVKERLSATGISKAELARRVGLSHASVSHLIHRSKKGSAHLHRIARELGTTPAYLSGETDDPYADLPTPLPLEAGARELIDRFANMCPADQRALLQVARSMSGPPASALPDERLRRV